MFKITHRRLMPACLPALLMAAAQASAQPPAPGADPLDPRAEVPSASHRSVLAGYRRHVDQPPASWKEVNETVNRIGGWRAYAREAQRPDAPAAAVPAPAQPATRGPVDHPGHHDPKKP